MEAFLRGKSVYVSIAVVLLLTLVASGSSFYNRITMEEAQAVLNRTNRIKQEMNNIFLNVRQMDISSRGYALMQKEQFLFFPLELAQETHKQTFHRIDSLLQAQEYYDPHNFQALEEQFANYVALYEKMVYLLRRGEIEAYKALLEQDIGRHIGTSLDRFNAKLHPYLADQIEKARHQYEAAIIWNSIAQAFLILVSFPTLILVIFKLKRNATHRNALISKLDEDNKKYLFDAGKNQPEEAKDILENSIGNLKKAASFVKRISEDDYSVTWEGMNDDNQAANQNNLVGALIQMRERMKAVKQEDQQRLWMTEGVSKVAEITRQHQDDQQLLADTLLSYLVSYTGANQGALFLLQENEPGDQNLALAACYAYNKKKHAEKAVKPGQGLVGQTYLEKKTQHITKVPDQYVSITSGLGEATANTLLLVPLTFNEQVMGILEIAAFNAFQSYQIAFLESVGEIIASAVATVRLNAKNMQLLKQSQEGGEALRAQEEEMRQNMEELQATQEEMQRKAHEYETIIEEQKTKIQRLEQAEA